MSQSALKKQKTQKSQVCGENMFQRRLAINANKKVLAERLFSYENATVPVSMFSEEGKMIIAKKSAFMHKIEGLLTDVLHDIEKPDTIIFDGTAIIQSIVIQSEQSTFKDMTTLFENYIVSTSRKYKSVQQIHIIFDTYSENSLKEETRRRRGDYESSSKVHVHSNLKIPTTWKKFLSSLANKVSLTQYYTGFLKENSNLKTHETIFINGGADTVP
ncbi:hypothetical protein DPMN_021545 [Dreissena polymorpha]|uniref:Uncharacterized protein n=1 Tax=Dreissena polymorpha TaxID=45954 RepID=A0A9D4NPD2_DREPO|nr:hypothetical protein DPMN_021545 [Dreissena polymorpha]